MDQQNKFDSQFRKKAREIKIKPSNDVWAGIDAELNKPKRISLYPILGIAASLILLIGVVSIFSTTKTLEHNANYQVRIMDSSSTDSYEQALMTWIESSKFNHPSETSDS